MALEEHMLIQDNQTNQNGLKMNLIMMTLNIIIMTGKKMVRYKLKLILQKKRVKPKNQKKKSDDDITIRKRECCSERIRKYLGLWFCFMLAIIIGILLMAEVSFNIGIIVFLIGFVGMFCSGFCYRKCG